MKNKGVIMNKIKISLLIVIAVLFLGGVSFAGESNIIGKNT